MVRLIQFAHMAVLTFVLTAWFWPWHGTLWLHVVLVPIMLLHWRTNENRCFLSELENKFRPASYGPVVRAEESQFIKMVYRKALGRVPNDRTLDRINYAVAGLVWSFSVARLMLTARIS